MLHPHFFDARQAQHFVITVLALQGTSHRRRGTLGNLEIWPNPAEHLALAHSCPWLGTRGTHIARIYSRTQQENNTLSGTHISHGHFSIKITAGDTQA